jgi:hypothetical protein
MRFAAFLIFFRWKVVKNGKGEEHSNDCQQDGAATDYVEGVRRLSVTGVSSEHVIQGKLEGKSHKAAEQACPERRRRRSAFDR